MVWPLMWVNSTRHGQVTLPTTVALHDPVRGRVDRQHYHSFVTADAQSGHLHVPTTCKPTEQ